MTATEPECETNEQEAAAKQAAGRGAVEMARHPLEAPELPLQRRFYTAGFPLDLRTNSGLVMAEAERTWKDPVQRFSIDPIRVDIHVIDSLDANGLPECPPEPHYRIMQPLLVCFADAYNYSVADLAQSRTQMVITRATLCHPLYFRWFFLQGAPACHISARYATPVHAACVGLGGQGVLLCGDSGAGKSSLAFACARSGLEYVSDDAVYLLHDERGNTVIGEPSKVRFRPSAAELFPEIAGMDITPRAAGKPSIELSTETMVEVSRADTAEVGAVVFLNRNTADTELRHYSRASARRIMQKVIFGPAEYRGEQVAAIDRLLACDVYELRYRDLWWAVDRVRRLLVEGH